MVEDEPLRGDGAALVDRGRGEGEVERDRGAIARAAREPRPEVHERDAHELPALVHRVAGGVRVVYGELDDLRGARLADECVDEEAAVINRKNLRGRWRVERRGVVYGPVQRDWLELASKWVRRQRQTKIPEIIRYVRSCTYIRCLRGRTPS